MPALTRRRLTDAREDCLHIYYGDVHAGTVFAGSSPITFTSPASKAHQKSGLLLRRHCTASTLIRPCPTPALAATCRNVEAATLADDGSPAITRTTIPTCRAHYHGGSSGCACRLLPHSCSLPQMAGGSASALSLSRPAQASHMLRPAGSLSRPRRPLSRGSSPSGHPAEPLVSYQINRQFSGWILPPQVIRAFGHAASSGPTIPAALISASRSPPARARR